MKAIIYGVTGQDGSYLSELLLSKDYTVYGVARRTSFNNTSRIKHLLIQKQFHLVQGDVTDSGSIYRLLNEVQVDEIYNLAAQSHVGTSFDQPNLTWNVTAQGCLNILEVIRSLGNRPRFYQAGSSEMFGDQYNLDNNREKYQDEHTTFKPQSPYGIAKLAAHHATRLYRDAYGIFACGGILFNHESERRGERFVTRKVTQYVADLYWATQKGRMTPKLQLGNLSAKRDWGHAEDYVKAMWLMLQQDEARDYVVATGVTHSVEELVKLAFQCININEYENYIEIDENLRRPSEVPYLRGCSKKAERHLGWKQDISFEELVKRMVTYDIQNRRRHEKCGKSTEESGNRK